MVVVGPLGGLVRASWVVVVHVGGRAGATVLRGFAVVVVVVVVVVDLVLVN